MLGSNRGFQLLKLAVVHLDFLGQLNQLKREQSYQGKVLELKSTSIYKPNLQEILEIVGISRSRASSSPLDPALWCLWIRIREIEAQIWRSMCAATHTMVTARLVMATSEL